MTVMLDQVTRALLDGRNFATVATEIRRLIVRIRPQRINTFAA